MSSEAPVSTQPPALFPVWRPLLCDGQTPVAVFARLRHALGGAAQHGFLLESVVGGERWARWSIIGVGHRAMLRGRWRSGRLMIEGLSGPGFAVDLSEFCGVKGGFGEDSGAAMIQRLLERYAAGPDPDQADRSRRHDHDELPRFWGGLVGVWGHDMVRDLERIPVPAARGRAAFEQGELPAFELLVTDTVVVFDNLTQRARVVAAACPAEDGGVQPARAAALRRVDAVIDKLRTGPALAPLLLDDEAPIPEARLAGPWQGSSFPDQVRQTKEYISAGDAFQVVLSQRFDQPRGELDPLDVYRMLRVTNPSPYMFLLELPSATLAGASPEVLVRVDPKTRKITVRPIAGTRRRGATSEEDLALERELLEDPKERAEHLMLIDLGRNDVGRIAEPGSVKLEESFVIERYSKVMHIVSEVSGVLAEGLGVVDALRSTFPAGTLSGAPKVRALEIIDEFEPAGRGWYGGAVGYFGFDGGADFAICIRSVAFAGDEVRVQAGAGLVYDSDPDSEDDECARKAAAVLRAIEMARAGRQAGSGGTGGSPS